MAGEQAERGSLSASFIKGRSTRYPNTTRTNLFRAELCVTCTLAARTKTILAEPANKWQRDTSAVHALSKNPDRHDLSALFNLALCHFEHKGIIPRLQLIRKVFVAGVANNDQTFADIGFKFMASRTTFASLELFHFEPFIARRYSVDRPRPQ